MAPAFPTQRAYQSFIEQIALQSPVLDTNTDIPEDHSYAIASTSILRHEKPLALAHISDIFADLSARDAQRDTAQDLPSSPEQLLKTLLPILVSAFLDSGPTAFSPEASAAPSTSTALESATNTIIAVAEISRDLWRSVLLRSMHQSDNIQQEEIVSGLEKLVGHMAVYFPFGNDELLKRSTSDSSRLQSLNITFCELVALVGLASQQAPIRSSNPANGSLLVPAANKVRRAKTKTVNATAAMSKYVASLLSSAQSSSILTSATTVTPHMYAQLLPTVWSLIWAADQDSPEQNILAILVRHFLDLPPTSGVKKLAFRFIARLLMVSSTYLRAMCTYSEAFITQLPHVCATVRLLPCGRNLQDLLASELHTEFLTALPRYLWEVGTKDEELSRAILFYIRHAQIVGTIPAASLEKLSSYLAPYFMSQHPKKGYLAGPWTKLNDGATMIQALETAWWLEAGRLSPEAGAALSRAVESALKARASDSLDRHWFTSLPCSS